MKHIGMVAVVLAFGGVALADDKPKPNARSTVERYVAAALAGKVDDAVALAVAGQSPSRKERIEEFQALVAAKAVKLPTVWADETKGQAVAVSEEVKITRANPDGRDAGHLTFELIKSGGKWRVKDIDFETAEKAKEQVEKFRKKYADAKELPPRAGT
jgi:hypothetical protein